MGKRALLLINPRSRRGADVGARAAQLLLAHGLELVEKPIEHLPSLSDTICRYRDRVDAVIVGGGDGTLSFAIDGLLATGLPLGIVPLGTANNLARTLGLPTHLSPACQAIAQGSPRSIDLGIVNGHYFFNVSGIGLSTEINRQVSRSAKHRWGSLAYIATATKVLRQANTIKATIRYRSGNASAETAHSDQTVPLEALQITVCNGRYYGNALIIADDATIDDARLDLYGFNIQRWWQGIRLLPELRWGHHRALPNVRYLNARQFTIETAVPCPVDADGEIVTATPATFEVRPKALSVLVPSDIAPRP